MNEPLPRSPPPSPTPDPSSHHDVPVVLDVAGWPCLVVGGGEVAVRRTRGLLAAGARVTVVAPVVAGAIGELAEHARAVGGPGPPLAVELRPYRSGEAAGYRLVVTATGRSEVDATVVADAMAGGALVNSAHRATPGNVRFPAVHRAGPVSLAVSTAGTSPALARWLCVRAAAGLPPELPTIAALVDEVRTAQQDAGQPTGSSDWAALLDQSGPLDRGRPARRGAGGPPVGRAAAGACVSRRRAQAAPPPPPR